MKPRHHGHRRHPLHSLLRAGLDPHDRQALLGDLEEEYRTHVRPTRSWLAAEAWYAGQIVAAAWSCRRIGTVVPLETRRPARRVRGIADVRYALRRWRRRPGFPIAATLTLGLGIGAATATFSVVDAVLLRPLPWPDADRLVAVHMVYPERRADPRYATTWNHATVHYPAWEALRRGASFEDVAVWHPPALSMTADEARTELVEVMDVSSNFLPMLGVRFALGGNFQPADDEQESYDLILSYEAWQARFGGRPDIIGWSSPIAYASDTHTPPWTIVGVLEPGFAFEGASPDVLRPIGGNARPFRTFFAGEFRTIARLAPGVSIEAASAEAAALIQASQPDVPLGGGVVPLVEEEAGPSARPLWLLFGAAGVLLIVACTNVAGLLVGEHRTRRHETAIRLALGITPGGIVRQLVVEHAMLAAAGAAVGLLLAAWLTGALVSLAPVELPRLDTVRIDWRIAWFAFGAGSLTLAAFGIAPALSLARTRAAEILADGGRESAPARHVAQRTVVATEIALAVILVVGASLLGETLFRLMSQPLGFDPTHVIVVSTRFTGSDIPPDFARGTRGAGSDGGRNATSGPTLAERMAAIRLARTEAIVERLSTLPGVERAAAIGGPPFLTRPASYSFNTAGLVATIRIDGRPPETPERLDVQSVTPGALPTLGVPVLEGRDLQAGDGPSAAVVSREFERQYFVDGAVGRRFEFAMGSRRNAYEVVGVAADLKQSTVSEDPVPTVYAIASAPHFVLRTAVDPGAILPAIRAAVAEVHPQVVVVSTTTMEAALAGVIAAERFRATLSTAFALIALVLSAVGLYAVAARRVADRRREFGIRVALGARPSSLGALVVRDGLLTVGLGLAAGLPAALAAAQVTQSLLFGVSATTPHVFLGTSALLAAAALAATLLPARRASRVDPMVALRD
ncbi:MAG: ABC transporter permease [Vicinamibacterales bacterium]